MRNSEVAKKWSKGERASSRHMRTDGCELKSYGLLIGDTDSRGFKFALDYTAAGGAFVSRTTSKHVGCAKRYADRVEEVN